MSHQNHWLDRKSNDIINIKENRRFKMAGKVYSIEYKIQAVKRVTEDCMSAAQVSRELGINVNTLREWVRRYREDNTEPFVGSGNQRTEARTMKELEKRIKDLEEENAILKKAAAIFAQNQKV